MADNATTDAPERSRRKVMFGRVMSTKMGKTITVQIERKVPHPLYGKIMKRYSTLYAHDEKEEASVGDLVYVMETRPLSKIKRWRLTEIARKS